MSSLVRNLLTVLVASLVSIITCRAVLAADQKLMACDSYPSAMLQKTVRYCTQRSRPDLPVISGEAVVYFMHGIEGDEKSFEENGYAEALDVLGQKESFPAFTVVSFETEAMSFFSDRGSFHAGTESYETWFTTEFMPMIEKKKNLCQRRACREIAGLSMGGFGALKTALRHSDLFSAVGVNSPALFPFNYSSSDAIFYAYFSRHPVGTSIGMAQLKIVRGIFTSWNYSDENDPIALIDRFWDRTAFPDVYLDVGGKDDFGFEEGYAKVTDAMNRKGFPYEAYFFPDAAHDLYKERRWDLMRFIAGKLPH